MISAVTIGHPHTGKAPQVILGPDVHFDEHIKRFKALCADRENKEFACVQVLSSVAGGIRSQKFHHPSVAEKIEKQQKAHELEQSKLAKDGLDRIKTEKEIEQDRISAEVLKKSSNPNRIPPKKDSSASVEGSAKAKKP